jgi:hypothetical protein
MTSSFTAICASKLSINAPLIKRGLLCGLLACSAWGTSPLRAADENQPVDQPAPQKGTTTAPQTGSGIIIRSNEDYRAAASGTAAGAQVGAGSAPAAAASGISYPRMRYTQAYAMIPFNRAEYEANPSYRHEAAMELMLGAPRPTTIVRQSAPYFSRYPDYIRYRHAVFPYGDACQGTLHVVHHYQTSVIID